MTNWTPKDHLEHQRMLEEYERQQKQAKPEAIKRPIKRKTKKKAAK